MMCKGQRRGGAGGQRAPGAGNGVIITPRREDAGLEMGEFSSWKGESKGWRRCLGPGTGDLEALSRLEAGGFSWCCPPHSLHQSPLGDWGKRTFLGLVST